MTDVLDLAGGNDMLDNRGGSIVGAILGEAGDDLFFPGTTAENTDGGEGCDTLDLSAYTTGVTIDLLDPVANKGRRCSATVSSSAQATAHFGKTGTAAARKLTFWRPICTMARSSPSMIFG